MSSDPALKACCMRAGGILKTVPACVRRGKRAGDGSRIEQMGLG